MRAWTEPDRDHGHARRQRRRTAGCASVRPWPPAVLRQPWLRGLQADADGLRLVERREATPEEDAALDAAAAETVAELGRRGVVAEIVSQRLNRRKIDLIPEPEWTDPPKARITELLEAVESRLRSAGLSGLRDAVEIALDAARRAGLEDPRVTSDAKHVEIGLTDKSDSARWAFEELARRGIGPRSFSSRATSSARSAA